MCQGELQVNFLVRTRLKTTGSRDMTARTARIKMELHERWPVADVIWYRVVPARMNRKEGGATPKWIQQELL